MMNNSVWTCDVKYFKGFLMHILMSHDTVTGFSIDLSVQGDSFLEMSGNLTAVREVTGN